MESEKTWILIGFKSFMTPFLNIYTVKSIVFFVVLQNCVRSCGWRYAELDRAVREKDSSIAKVREAAQEREAQLLADVRGLTSELEQSSVKIRQLEWRVQDLEKDKAAVVERCS